MATTKISGTKITTEDLEAFFDQGLYNSYKATDELIKNVELTHDETITDRLLQLYQHHYSSLDRPWEHVTFMYGLGLIYMHFSAYNWAVKSFRDAIYVQPSFPKSKDVHTRLGLIFKATGRYKLSEKHFNLAINDTRLENDASTKLELRFQLAHLHEIQGKHKQAIEIYESLLQEKDLPQRLRANINRQLGWVQYNATSSCHPSDLLHESRNDHRRMEAALQYLDTSDKTERNSETSYYLGRCLTNIGKFQDAFASYRSVIDREESTADTWCSIGVLYQRQNQPWDALQAYIRSVQYEKKHVVAWMNLGILYESHNQFKDALKCYQHVVRFSKNVVDKSFYARINHIQRYLRDIDASTAAGNNQKKAGHDSDKLLSLEDLWNLESKNNQDNNLTTSSNSTDNPSAVDNCQHLGLQTQISEAKEFCFSQAITNGASKDSGISSDSSNYSDCALVPSQCTDISSASYMFAEQVVDSCKDITRLPLKLDINLTNDINEPPPSFYRSPPYPPLPSDKMFPSPPSIFLESKKELSMKRLQDLCHSNPISIVRNIATVLKLDLGLFSTKTLGESNPDQQVIIVSHLSNPSIQTELNNSTNSANEEDINFAWTCERIESSSTISRYASYQVSSFRESLQSEKDNRLKPQLAKESETDSNESSATSTVRKNGIISMITSPTIPDQRSNGSYQKKMKTQDSKNSVKYVKSADFIDLSDEKRWRPQLNELNKLPHFLKCVSASNMLTHIGANIPGVNTTSLSMHVPGCRIIGNRAPNCFCPVTINTGPGDYEWCAISGEYESVLTRLCTKDGLDIDSRNWWPKLSDLQKYNVPIYRFSQRPGDLVWVNSGTFYWVHSTGWANCIQWNIGPLCAKQYRVSSHSFELNKLTFRKSNVPMIQLTWNIVMNINIITDDDLFNSMTDVLKRSLRYCVMVREYIEQTNEGKKVKIVEVEPGPRLAKYCSLCEIEIFNLSFKKKHSDELHCVECTKRVDQTLNDYKIYQEYDLKHLMRMYDNFIKVKQKFQARELLMEQNRLQQQMQPTLPPKEQLQP